MLSANDDENATLIESRGEADSLAPARRAHPGSSLTSHATSARLLVAGWRTGPLVGFVGGVVFSCFATLLMTAALNPLPSLTTSVSTSSTVGLPLDWVPAQQPRVPERMRWMAAVLPLDELYALRRSSDQPPASIDTANPNLFYGALRSFFANYTRFHARSMRSLGPDTKFVISRARGYYEQGMGNRLFALASAFLLAALTDRVFIVDWSRHPEDGFDIGDVFDEPPIDWRISQLEQRYGRDAIVEAEGQTANYISIDQHWQLSRPAFEELLCGGLDRWRGSDSPQVLLVDSNQFFAPLMWHNPRLRARLEAWGFTNGQLGVWVLRYLFHPVAAVREQMDQFKAQHWRPYMIGVQLRTRDGHATSEEITSLAYRCALLLTDALPLSWKQTGHIGWYLATDDERSHVIGQALLSNFSYHTGLPAPVLVYAPCSSPLGVSAAVSKYRCALMHMALLAEVDDLVASKKSTFGEVGHVLSGLAPMVLTSQLTCVRQPVADPCFHHWHHVKKLECFEPNTIRSASLEDINGRCMGEGTNWPT